MSQHDASLSNQDARRRGVRRTAWIVALVAVGVYAGFMVMAVVK
jgi:hypothetical protein